MSIQFIACTADDCPFNELRQCLSPHIRVEDDGRCSVRKNGPFDNKSPTEKYVELKECHCKSCNYWEVNKVSQKGDCGICEDLFFNMLKTKDEDNPKKSYIDGPFCHAFNKQVPKTPPFQTSV